MVKSVHMAKWICTILITLWAVSLIIGCANDPPQTETPQLKTSSEGTPAPSSSALPEQPSEKEDSKPEVPASPKCIRQCTAKCELAYPNTLAYYKEKEKQIENSPFTITIDRSYLSGACAKGDNPSTRKNAAGIKAVVEGQIQYTGKDILINAHLDGAMFLHIKDDHIAQVSAFNDYYSRSKNISRITRTVRGADPWLPNEKRPFHFETKSINEGYCEILPKSATAYVELKTNGIVSGEESYPIGMINLSWDEVIGMGLRQQINVLQKINGKETIQPADAHYSKLDRILVTQLTGKTEWIRKSVMVQKDEFKKGPGAGFPVEASTDEFQINVTGITSLKEFGGYAPKGEDQSLTILDIELVNTGEQESSIGKFSARLETSPGVWNRPISTALGQLDPSESLPAGSSISGKLAFPRQRFDRPFRLEVKTPDGSTVYLDVLSYQIAPERSPL